MSFADNVLNKMKATPAFRPSSLDTFGDWSIEAGDVIQVDVEGKTENVPVFSSDMSWNGAAETTISCSGNEKREMQDHQTRQAYNTAYGIGQRIGSVEEETIETKAGLDQITTVERDERGNLKYALAEAKVFASIKDGENFKEAFMNVGVREQADGKMLSFADIVADVTTIHGNLDIKDGGLHSDKSIMSDLSVIGKDINANGGEGHGIISGRRVTCTELALNGREAFVDTINYVSRVYADYNGATGTPVGVIANKTVYLHVVTSSATVLRLGDAPQLASEDEA